MAKLSVALSRKYVARKCEKIDQNTKMSQRNTPQSRS